MAEPSADFALLIERARQGDEGAVADLIRNYEPDVRVLARIRLGSALRPYLDSVDLVQSVHKSVIRGLRGGRFDISTPEKLVALAMTMVRRKVAHHWRRAQKQQRGKLTDAGANADPGRAAEFDDALGRLYLHLDATERRLVELKIQGYSTVDAALEMGEDADALRIRLFRLRRRIREDGVLAEWR